MNSTYMEGVGPHLNDEQRLWILELVEPPSSPSLRNISRQMWYKWICTYKLDEEEGWGMRQIQEAYFAIISKLYLKVGKWPYMISVQIGERLRNLIFVDDTVIF